MMQRIKDGVASKAKRKFNIKFQMKASRAEKSVGINFLPAKHEWMYMVQMKKTCLYTIKLRNLI